MTVETHSIVDAVFNDIIQGICISTGTPFHVLCIIENSEITCMSEFPSQVCILSH